MDNKHHRIALDQIVPPSTDLRANVDADALHGLAESIREMGLLCPILVRPCGEKFEIIAGNRRYLAHQWLGRTSILAMVNSGAINKVDLLRLTENIQRLDLTPLEEARAVTMLKEQEGLNAEEIAKRLGKSAAWVRVRLQVFSWPDEILAALQSGGVGLAVAGHLAAIGDDLERRRLLQFAADSGASARTVLSWRAAWEATQAAVDTETAAATLQNPTVQPLEMMFPCWWTGTPTKVVGMQIIRLSNEAVVYLTQLKQEIAREELDRRNQNHLDARTKPD